MNGYNENFLDGISLPLPTFNQEISLEVFGNSALRSGIVADYVNYSVVMNKESNKRSPLFVALNINQEKFKGTSRSDKWKVDTRIGIENQLDNNYYKNNPWDRGHMAMRQNAGWGDTPADAQRAANETFYYTNSCLQHENLNQDEWLGLEQWVYSLDLDADGRITSFSGPIYADYDRTIRPSGRKLALIPSGFFKIVCFKNKDTGKLDVRAFVMYQDEKALKDKVGRKKYNNQTYQTTVAYIEELTGLRFDKDVYLANPMLQSEYSDRNTGEPVPEHVEVGKAGDILSANSPRQTLNDDIVDIFISAAMVDPSGPDTGKEWISLINLGASVVDLTGWTLVDNSDKKCTIANTSLSPGESAIIHNVKPLLLSNTGDVIKLFDGRGARIDWVNYTERMVSSGKPVVFLQPRDTLD